MIVLVAICLALLVVILAVLAYMIRFIKSFDGTILDPTGAVKEIMDSLHLASSLAAGVAKDLSVNIAEARQQFSRLVVLLSELQATATAATESGVRIEAEGGRVADDLAELQSHARTIESDPKTQPGEAADFAAGGNDRVLPKATRKRKT